MTRPLDLPAAEAFEHGTRSRYVCGCRCRPCKDANLARYHARQRQAVDRASDVVPTGPAVAGDLVRGGRIHKVWRCPGANGNPCVRRGGAWLRGKHQVCTACVVRETIWNGLVPAARARRHLQKLSAAGIGRDTVADIAGVGVTTINDVRTGAKDRIRKTTERAILRVTTDAMTDARLVPAARVWARIEQLIRYDGFTKAEIARRLGLKTPALQFNRKRMTARTVARFERFIRQLDLGGSP